MPIATLYDVHGNIRALEAVLAEIPDDATIVVGGDVAVGPKPSETLELLRSLGDRVLWLRGNADRELTPGEPGLAPPAALDAVRVEQVEGDDGSLIFRLHVAEGDVGKVIGRQGRIARALRTIVRAGGPNAGRRLQLEIVG
jgi:predicted RNA-binding protein YlqC (UPF0109 family)